MIGKNKYADMYNLSVHEAAAYTIGRRALGYSEKVSLYSYPSSMVKSIILGTLEEKYGNRKFHEWSYWRIIKSKKQTVLTGLRRSMRDLPDMKSFDKAAKPRISANRAKIPIVNPTT